MPTRILFKDFATLLHVKDRKLTFQNLKYEIGDELLAKDYNGWREEDDKLGLLNKKFEDAVTIDMKGATFSSLDKHSDSSFISHAIALHNVYCDYLQVSKLQGARYRIVCIQEYSGGFTELVQKLNKHFYSTENNLSFTKDLVDLAVVVDFMSNDMNCSLRMGAVTGTEIYDKYGFEHPLFPRNGFPDVSVLIDLSVEKLDVKRNHLKKTLQSAITVSHNICDDLFTCSQP